MSGPNWDDGGPTPWDVDEKFREWIRALEERYKPQPLRRGITANEQSILDRLRRLEEAVFGKKE